MIYMCMYTFLIIPCHHSDENEEATPSPPSLCIMIQKEEEEEGNVFCMKRLLCVFFPITYRTLFCSDILFSGRKEGKADWTILYPSDASGCLPGR